MECLHLEFHGGSGGIFADKTSILQNCIHIFGNKLLGTSVGRLH